MAGKPCPACATGRRRQGQYLCRDDWFTLPEHARRALNLRDSKAMARLQELHRQISAGVPLVEITVTP